MKQGETMSKREEKEKLQEINKIILMVVKKIVERERKQAQQELWDELKRRVNLDDRNASPVKWYEADFRKIEKKFGLD